jgi:hypothetical protein
MVEGMDNALAEGWWEFRGIARVPGRAEAVLLPVRPSYCGKAFGEGWLLTFPPERDPPGTRELASWEGW